MSKYKRADEPVEDMYDLLYWMRSNAWNVSDGLLRKRSGNRWEVERDYDRGYYATSDRRPVPNELAEQAVTIGFVTERPIWGGTEHNHFVITERGRQHLRELEKTQAQDEQKLLEAEIDNAEIVSGEILG